MGTVFGAALNIDMRILGARIVQEQLAKTGVAIASIGRSMTQVNQQFRGLNQAQIAGHARTMETFSDYGRVQLRSKEINEANRQAMKALFGETKKVNKEMAQFDMRMLSLLFGGMALKRAFGAALKSIYNSFKKAEGFTSAFTEATTRLSAGWEFLKFSIFNALDQPVVIRFIDWVLKGINLVSEWINKYPALGVAILGVFTTLFGVGGIMLLAGQFSLGWASMFGVGGLLAKTATAGMGTTAAAAGTLTGAFATAFAVMAAIAAAGLIIYVTYKLAEKFVPPAQDWFLEKKEFFPEDVEAGGIARRISRRLEGTIVGDIWNKVLGTFGVELPKAFGESTAHIKVLDDGTKILTASISALDEAIYKKSLQPSMVLLNEEFNTNVIQTDLLNEKYPILIEQTNNQSSAVDNLASSYRELASSIEAVASARSEAVEEQTSSVTG